MPILEFSAGGAVIKKDGKVTKVLLIKDSYGRWTWPKGKIAKGEKPLEAAIREIKEETGLSGLDLVGELDKINYFYKLKGKLIYKTVYLFVFHLKGPQELKIQTSEIQEGGWFSAKEALGMVSYKGAEELLERAIKSFEER